MGDAGEETGAAAGDGEVGDVADVAVEDGLASGARPGSAPARHARVGEGADHRRRPRGRRRPARRPARRSGSTKEATMSRRAATTTTSTWGAAPSSAGHAADDLVLEHGLVERHRHLLLGLEADRRLHLLRVLDRRQAQRCGRRPAGCRCRAAPAWRACCSEKSVLERRGEAVRVERPRPRGRRRARAARSPTRSTRTEPLSASTSVAAMLPASMSRPTTAPSSSSLPGAVASTRTPLNRQKGRRPFALQLLISRRTWTDLREGAQVPVDAAGRRRAARRRRRGRGTGRTGSPSCGPTAPSRAIIARPTSEPASSATRIAGATLRPRKRPIVAASLTSPRPIPRG